MPMSLKGCEFLLTFKCIAKCRHCCYRASPLRRSVMAVDDFKKYMTILAHEQSLDCITFHGGEPFLFYKTLKRCIEIAHKLGQKEIELITNGYWGGNQTNAQRKLQELKKAGLSSIRFSVDTFHQEFVPFHSVHTAIDVARAIGFNKLVIISRFLGSVGSRNPVNMRTETLLERLGPPENFIIERKPLYIEGRAADQLAKHLQQKVAVPKGICVLQLRADETLKNPSVIQIDPFGNVTICPGLCIGNAKTEPLSRIMKEYDYERNPIVRLLAQKGPIRLLELPEARGSVEPAKSVSDCHMCYELRKHLRACYPEFLAPDNCYSE